MSEVIKLCKCGKSPKVYINVDSFFEYYTIICPNCGIKKKASLKEKAIRKWNRNKG